MPPIPLSFTLISSLFQRFLSANLLYIRNRSAAKSAASSPPAPARISTNTFFSSLGSFGRSKSFNSFSSSGICFFASARSSFKSSRISSSRSCSKSSRFSSMLFFVFLYCVQVSTRGASSACSFIRRRNFSESDVSTGSPSS